MQILFALEMTNLSDIFDGNKVVRVTCSGPTLTYKDLDGMKRKSMHCKVVAVVCEVNDKNIDKLISKLKDIKYYLHCLKFNKSYAFYFKNDFDFLGD